MAPQKDFPALPDRVPWSETVTDYDRAHLKLYIQLLDAAAAGATHSEMASALFGVEPGVDPERADAMVASHLHRAEWMTKQGYRQLLTTS
jgi:hypothetical protein